MSGGSRAISLRVHTINALGGRNLRNYPTRRCGRAPADFKKRVAAGASLDDIPVEVFATVREAGQATSWATDFDVQLIGGMVLHEGQDFRDEDRA